ncbi:hypothetical protein H1C71_009088, partial [Ictidomys tridecemlineatus]
RFHSVWGNSKGTLSLPSLLSVRLPFYPSFSSSSFSSLSPVCVGELHIPITIVITGNTLGRRTEEGTPCCDTGGPHYNLRTGGDEEGGKASVVARMLYQQDTGRKNV